MQRVSFSQRLYEAITLRKIKPVELSRISGISKSSISEYLSGKFEPRQDGIYALSKALKVNEAWLMGFDVPMNDELKKEVVSNIMPIPDKPISIPVIGKISAGLPILAVENIIDYAFAPSSQIKNGYEYFYLVVEGDSMNLKFQEGNIVLVQQQDDLENDEIGVIMIDDEATVKKYKSENGLIILQPMSNNPKHQVQIYNPKDKKIKIIGKVISYQGTV